MSARASFPGILKEVARATHDAMEDRLDGATCDSWNQCIVNAYRDREGIGRHVDNKPKECTSEISDRRAYA